MTSAWRRSAGSAKSPLLRGRMHRSWKPTDHAKERAGEVVRRIISRVPLTARFEALRDGEGNRESSMPSRIFQPCVCSRLGQPRQLGLGLLAPHPPLALRLVVPGDGHDVLFHAPQPLDLGEGGTFDLRSFTVISCAWIFVLLIAVEGMTFVVLCLLLKSRPRFLVPFAHRFGLEHSMIARPITSTTAGTTAFPSALRASRRWAEGTLPATQSAAPSASRPTQGEASREGSHSCWGCRGRAGQRARVVLVASRLASSLVWLPMCRPVRCPCSRSGSGSPTRLFAASVSVVPGCRPLSVE